MVEKQQLDLDYTIRELENLLIGYRDLKCGYYSGYEDETTRFNVFESPFESSACKLADLDMAIDKLGKPGAWLKWSRNVEDNINNVSTLSFKQSIIANYLDEPYNFRNNSLPNNLISELHSLINGKNTLVQHDVQVHPMRQVCLTSK